MSDVIENVNDVIEERRRKVRRNNKYVIGLEIRNRTRKVLQIFNS